MTLLMADSVDAGALGAGYDAYLGYVDGEFVTGPQLAARFPAARHVLLTVTGRTLEADGCDVENLDLTPVSGASWVNLRLGRQPASRPVVYASVSAMAEVRDALAALHILRARVRLLSAHFGGGPHICGPHSCDLIDIEMDGTQYTNEAPGLGGALIDLSMLADDFFGQVSETEMLVQELGQVHLGMTGSAVKTVQGLCAARLITAAPVIDGVFGPATLAAVKRVQQLGEVSHDGIVGPQTWPVLLAVA